MQTSKQSFPPDFVYLLHVAPLLMPESALDGEGDEDEDVDEALPDTEDEDDEQADYDDAA